MLNILEYLNFSQHIIRQYTSDAYSYRNVESKLSMLAIDATKMTQDTSNWFFWKRSYPLSSCLTGTEIQNKARSNRNSISSIINGCFKCVTDANEPRNLKVYDLTDRFADIIEMNNKVQDIVTVFRIQRIVFSNFVCLKFRNDNSERAWKFSFIMNQHIPKKTLWNPKLGPWLTYVIMRQLVTSCA